MSFLKFYKDIFNFKKIKVKVAVVEALSVTISTVFTLLPWNFNFNVNSLILTPVLCVVVACNVSSFLSIHLSITMLLGTFVSSLYLYLILLITREIIWITFITGFVFCYIINAITQIPGRRWITGLFMKKLFLDCMCTLYFSPIENAHQTILHNIYGGCFIVGSVTVAQIIIPTISSRLVFRKVLKSMDSTRLYFKICQDLYKLSSNNNSNIGYGDNSTISGRKQTFNQKMFEQMENQLIKEQHTKFIQNEIYKPRLVINENSKYRSLTLCSNKKCDEPVVVQDNKLKLTLARNVIIEKNNVDIGNHRSNNSNIEMLNITENNNASSPQVSIEFNNSTNGIDELESKLYKIEKKLTNQVNTMIVGYSESKNEKWNNNLNSYYNSLITMFEKSLKQLISIKLSIKDGFSQVSINQELVLPLIPFIDCLVEEVYLQMGILSEILKSKNTEEQESITQLLYKSFDETKDLVNGVKVAFKQVVNDYQNHGDSSTSLLNHEQVDKVHFFVYEILSFALQQREFANLLIKVKKQQPSYSARYELIRYGLLYVITGFPFFVFKQFMFFKDLFCLNKQQVEDDKENNKQNKFILLMKWIMNNFFISGKWRFPLQVSIAMTSSIITFYYLDGKTDSSGKFQVHGLWVCITVLFVFCSQLGATITRGVHRINGTIAGALVGFGASLLCHQIPSSPWREIVILALTFIFIFIISFPQQHLEHSYAGAVSGLTFILVLIGQNLSQNYDYMYAILRCFYIIIGVLWNIIIGMVVFPYFTYKGSRIKVFQITNLMSDSFTNIIENGLRMNEIIFSKNNNDGLELFNHDGDEFQQSNDIINKRKEFIIKLISTHKDDLIDGILNNQNDNINNVICVQNSKVIEKRIKNKKQINESLRSIRIGITQVKGSLKDIKSEMYFISPLQSTKYYTIYENLNECLTRLVSLENSFNPIFSDLLILSMFDLVKPLNDLFQQLFKLKSDLKLIMSDKQPSIIINQHCNLIKEKLNLFNIEFQSTRLFLLNQRVFHHLHPEQLQFGSGIYSIQMFIQHYTALLESLNLIVIEKSYLTHILNKLF